MVGLGITSPRLSFVDIPYSDGESCFRSPSLMSLDALYELEKLQDGCKLVLNPRMLAL